MSATQKQLRDQIILDAGVENHPKFPTLRLNRIIDLAARYIQAQLNGLGMKKWETSNVITAGLVAGGFAAADSPGNCKKCPVNATYFPNMLESPKSIQFIQVNDASNYGIAYEVDPNYFQEQLFNTYLGPTVSKPVFMRLAGYVWIAPVGITAATAHFYDTVADLANDAAETEIPLEFESHLIKKAVMDIQEDLGVLQNREIKVAALNKEINDQFEKFFGKISNQSIHKQTDKAKLQ